MFPNNNSGMFRNIFMKCKTFLGNILVIHLFGTLTIILKQIWNFWNFFINNMNFWLIIFWGSFWVNILFGTLWNVSNNSATFWNIFLECLLTFKKCITLFWSILLVTLWRVLKQISFGLFRNKETKKERNKQRMAGLQLMFACNVAPAYSLELRFASS